MSAGIHIFVAPAQATAKTATNNATEETVMLMYRYSLFDAKPVLRKPAAIRGKSVQVTEENV